MTPDYAAIRDALATLRAAVPPPRVFGSGVHAFQLNPPLGEAEVSAFEVAHRVTLPNDYRGFLTEAGNGGAGPYYGLFRLGEMDDGPWREGDGFVGVLAEPFPHVGPWNDLTGRPEFDDSRADDLESEDEHGERLDAWEAEYFRTVNVNGAVPICHLGCAQRQWLVVTGPEAGNVWDDRRVDHDGLRPVVSDRRRVSFLEWYCGWLDDAIHSASQR